MAILPDNFWDKFPQIKVKTRNVLKTRESFKTMESLLYMDLKELDHLKIDEDQRPVLRCLLELLRERYSNPREDLNERLTAALADMIDVMPAAPNDSDCQESAEELIPSPPRLTPFDQQPLNQSVPSTSSEGVPKATATTTASTSVPTEVTLELPEEEVKEIFAVPSTSHSRLTSLATPSTSRSSNHLSVPSTGRPSFPPKSERRRRKFVRFNPSRFHRKERNVDKDLEDVKEVTFCDRSTESRYFVRIPIKVEPKPLVVATHFSATNTSVENNGHNEEEELKTTTIERSFYDTSDDSQTIDCKSEDTEEDVSEVSPLLIDLPTNSAKEDLKEDLESKPKTSTPNKEDLNEELTPKKRKTTPPKEPQDEDLTEELETTPKKRRRRKTIFYSTPSRSAPRSLKELERKRAERKNGSIPGQCLIDGCVQVFSNYMELIAHRQSCRSLRVTASGSSRENNYLNDFSADVRKEDQLLNANKALDLLKKKTSLYTEKEVKQLKTSIPLVKISRVSQRLSSQRSPESQETDHSSGEEFEAKPQCRAHHK